MIMPLDYAVATTAGPLVAVSVERPTPLVKQRPAMDARSPASMLPSERARNCAAERWIDDNKPVAAALVLGLAWALRGAK